VPVTSSGAISVRVKLKTLLKPPPLVEPDSATPFRNRPSFTPKLGDVVPRRLSTAKSKSILAAEMIVSVIVNSIAYSAEDPLSPNEAPPVAEFEIHCAGTAAVAAFALNDAAVIQAG